MLATTLLIRVVSNIDFWRGNYRDKDMPRYDLSIAIFDTIRYIVPSLDLWLQSILQSTSSFDWIYLWVAGCPAQPRPADPMCPDSRRVHIWFWQAALEFPASSPTEANKLNDRMACQNTAQSMWLSFQHRFSFISHSSLSKLQWL